MNNLSLSSTVSVTKEVVYCLVEEETVLLGLKNGIYYGLNPTGTFIWNLIQKPIKVNKIRDAILGEFKVNEDECNSDLFEILNQFIDYGLIEVKND